jgi:hypothetical protein
MLHLPAGSWTAAPAAAAALLVCTGSPTAALAAIAAAAAATLLALGKAPQHWHKPGRVFHAAAASLLQPFKQLNISHTQFS